MKKLLISASLILFTATAAWAYDAEQAAEDTLNTFMVVGVIVFLVQLYIIYEIIKSATKSKKLVQLNEIQIELLMRLLKERTGEDVTVETLMSEAKLIDDEVNRINKF